MKASRPPALNVGPKKRRYFRPNSDLFLVAVAAAAAQWFGGATVVSASYSEVQFSGLEALYTVTGGEQWTSSTGWLGSVAGVCSWYGVTCDSSGQNVTALSLAGNSLTGNLSDAAELFNISSLVSIDLSNNELVGPVAPGFGLMPGLEVLDLSRNELSSLPASWGAEASSLQHLSLQLNNIFGYVFARRAYVPVSYVRLGAWYTLCAFEKVGKTPRTEMKQLLPSL